MEEINVYVNSEEESIHMCWELWNRVHKVNNLNYEEAHRITAEIHLEVRRYLPITCVCMIKSRHVWDHMQSCFFWTTLAHMRWLVHYFLPYAQLHETGALTSVNLFLLLDRIFCYKFYALYRLITRFEISDWSVENQFFKLKIHFNIKICNFLYNLYLQQSC